MNNYGFDLTFFKRAFTEQYEIFSWTWQEVYFALKNGIVTFENVVDYSRYIYNEDIIGEDIVLQLLLSDSQEEVVAQLKKIIVLEEEQNQEDMKYKWLYIILYWLYYNRTRIMGTNVFEVIVEIYNSFMFPREIESFLWYLASSVGDIATLEDNHRALMQNWYSYLKRNDYYLDIEKTDDYL